MKVTKRIKMVALALLLTLGLGGSAIGISYAASNSKVQASDMETNDDTPANGKSLQDNGKDGETKDDTKSATAATNVQDNGQDGETNDGSGQ